MRLLLAPPAAGTALGELPLQRLSQIGGATSVRGHDAAALRGESVLLARGDGWGIPALPFSASGDARWAGRRDELRNARPPRGVGVGVSLLDNLLRFELARGIGGGALRLHLGMGGAP